MFKCDYKRSVIRFKATRKGQRNVWVTSLRLYRVNREQQSCSER